MCSFALVTVGLNRRSFSDGSDRTEMNCMAEPELQVVSRILPKLSSFPRSQSHNTMQHCFDESSSDFYDLCGKILKNYAFSNFFYSHALSKKCAMILVQKFSMQFY
jgi:hypothetical protein